MEENKTLIMDVERQKKSYEKLLYDKDQEMESLQKDFENEKGILYTYK